MVNVNDCRAYIVPLANRDPEDPSEVFDESESHCTGISPNSGCMIYGRVKGQINTRLPIVFTQVKKEPMEVRTSLVSKISHSKVMAALPPIPEDPEVNSVQLVINATSRYLF